MRVFVHSIIVNNINGSKECRVERGTNTHTTLDEHPKVVLALHRWHFCGASVYADQGQRSSSRHFVGKQQPHRTFLLHLTAWSPSCSLLANQNHQLGFFLVSLVARRSHLSDLFNGLEHHLWRLLP